MACPVFYSQNLTIGSAAQSLYIPLGMRDCCSVPGQIQRYPGNLVAVFSEEGRLWRVIPYDQSNGKRNV